MYYPFTVKNFEALLSKEGVQLVLADPDLTYDTMAALLRTDPPNPDDKFWFGQNGECDIGITCLSSCISDNPNQSIAELVGRYAEVRKTSFTSTALAVLRLKKQQGLVHFKKDKNGGIAKTIWEPMKGKAIPAEMPPKKAARKK